MQRTNIYLDAEQIAALDQLAHEQQTSRADVIRRLVDRGLEGSRLDAHSDTEVIHASFGALSSIGGSQRDAGQRQEHLDQMWELND